MKILELTFQLSSGGGEHFTVDLSNALSKTENVVLVQIRSNKNHENAYFLNEVRDNIKYINLNCSSATSIRTILKICSVIRQENPDIVHANCGLLQIALPALIFKRISFFHTIHSIATRYSTRYLDPMYHKLYKYRVRAVTISKVCMNSFASLYHLDSICIYNGRSKPQPSPDAKSVEKEVQGYKNHPDDVVFIHIARYHIVKHQDLLFSTFERLFYEGQHVILIVLGSGFFVKSHANIHILGEKRNIADYLAVSDRFILSSYTEGLPISLLEAMSYGVIPTATPAGGICDIIRNGENGYISKSHNPEDFYNCVIKSIKNTDGIDAKTIIAQYERDYSINRCAKEYLSLFESTIQQ